MTVHSAIPQKQLRGGGRSMFALFSACFCTNTYTACIVQRLVKDPTGKRTFQTLQAYKSLSYILLALREQLMNLIAQEIRALQEINAYRNAYYLMEAMEKRAHIHCGLSLNYCFNLLICKPFITEIKDIMLPMS